MTKSHTEWRMGAGFWIYIRIYIYIYINIYIYKNIYIYIYKNIFRLLMVCCL